MCLATCRTGSQCHRHWQRKIVAELLDKPRVWSPAWLPVVITAISVYPVRRDLLTTRPPPVVPQPRILGGQRVGDRCQAPFNAMVALKIQMSDQTNSRTYCGAVMLTSQWLVTAALCVFP